MALFILKIISLPNFVRTTSLYVCFSTKQKVTERKELCFISSLLPLPSKIRFFTHIQTSIRTYGIEYSLQR